MFDRFLKITSTSGEHRWINLDRVTRVSLAVDSAGEPILAFCFDGSDQVKIHGSDDASRKLIRRIAAAFDEISDVNGVKQAA